MKNTKVNYALVLDGIYTTIEETTRPANEVLYIYPSLSKAKKEADKYFQRRIEEFKNAKVEMKNVKCAHLNLEQHNRSNSF
jgi:hypothetical protein